jgi:hypothetical protein
VADTTGAAMLVPVRLMYGLYDDVCAPLSSWFGSSA